MPNDSLNLTEPQDPELPEATDSLELENLLNSLQDILDQWTRES
jgi:hypothetical protein